MAAAYKRIQDADDGADMPRSRQFYVTGKLYEDGHLYPKPFRPPSVRVFDMFFFRQMFDKLQSEAFSAELHVLVVRGASVKLMDMYGLPHERDVSFFGRGGINGDSVNTWYSWQDFVTELVDFGHPRIALNFAEQLFLSLEDHESCRLAGSWFNFIMLVTVCNLLAMVFPPLPGAVAAMLFPSCDRDWSSDLFRTFCTLVFTLEYMTKVVCIPFIRLEIVDGELTLSRLVDVTSPDARPFTKWQALAHFFCHGQNLVDWVAIMPFWMTLIIGDSIPNASFLRLIRMARIFRVFKAARFLDILQVLGLTLWKSIGMVFALFMLFAILGLIIGCLLYQLEHADAFESVPTSMYWIFVRLLNVKDIPAREGAVATTSGVIVLTVTMALKGILWIIPMERIKQIYLSEFRSVSTMGDMRKEMDEFLTNKHKAGARVGSTTFARIELSPCDWDVLKSGVAVATLNLPVLQQKESIADVDVAFPQCSGFLVIRVEWRPTADMMKAKSPAMPEGLLKLSVVMAAGFPGHLRQRWRCGFHVPEQLFGTVVKESFLSLCDPVAFDIPREFNIQWVPSHLTMDDTRTSIREPQADHLMDDAVFRRRALTLLKEQKSLLADQSAKIDNQSRQMEEYTRRLERLEVRLQERPGS